MLSCHSRKGLQRPPSGHLCGLMSRFALVRRIDGVTVTETPGGEPKAAAADVPAPAATPASETKAVPLWKRLFGKS